MMQMSLNFILAACITTCSCIVPVEEEVKAAISVSMCGDENDDGTVNAEEMTLFLSKNNNDFIYNRLIPNAGGVPDFVFKHMFSHDKNLDSKITQEAVKKQLNFQEISIYVLYRARKACFRCDLSNTDSIDHEFDKETKAYALVHTKGIKYCQRMQQLTKMLTRLPNTKEKAETFSKCIDVNNDGELTKEEFSGFFGMPELSEEVRDVNGLDDFIARMMVKYDGNNDGMVTNTEFRAVAMVYFQLIKVCGK